MTISAKFNWPAIDDTQFEELILAIVKSKGAIRAEFRKGPNDKGRDVQAWFKHRDSLGVESQDAYFFEAKHHTKGVSLGHISDALAWAHAEQPHSMVLAASSHFTNSCRENINHWKQNNSKIRVLLWERPNLEELILSNSILQDFAVSVRLLPPSVRRLLPPNPERYRLAEDGVESGLEMAYRYWLTEDDVNDLEAVSIFVERCATILEENNLSEKYFEMTHIGVPNWATWLRLMRAECLLQIAVRDYLFAQVSGAESERMNELASAIRERVQLINNIGEKPIHEEQIDDDWNE